MKRNIQDFPISLDAMFKLFSAFSKAIYKDLDTNKLILFEIDSLKDRTIIEEIILSGREKSKILSNKSKSLLFYINQYIAPDNGELSFRFIVGQKKANGVLLETDIIRYSEIKTDCGDLALLLKVLNDKYQMETYKKEQNQKSLKFQHSMMLLEEKDLRIFLSNRIIVNATEGFIAQGSKKYLTSFEQKQVIYTYEVYKRQYDFYPCKIDDGEQRKEAETKNSYYKPILDLCEKVAKEFGFELEAKKQEATE